MRLFIAIDLPESVTERLSIMSCGLPGASWAQPDQMHLTLRFIGEVDGTMFKDIQESLADIRFKPFSIQLQDVGFFPPRKKPRVVWVGLGEESKEQLIRLRNRIESAMVRLGLEPEGRKYAPHITLARLHNTPANRVGRFLEQHSMFIMPPFEVNGFRLYSSVLNARGARHYVEQTYPLV